MFFRHPSKRALQEWLDHGESATIDEHLADCQRCASVLEQIATEEEPALRDALTFALAPPDDFAERLEQKVSARLDSRVMLGVVSDLFGAGLETSKLLLLEEPTDE
jgi:predicted anti-sigma-YlaC factor YlaD